MGGGLFSGMNTKKSNEQSTQKKYEVPDPAQPKQYVNQINKEHERTSLDLQSLQSLNIIAEQNEEEKLVQSNFQVFNKNMMT